MFLNLDDIFYLLDVLNINNENTDCIYKNIHLHVVTA